PILGWPVQATELKAKTQQLALFLTFYFWASGRAGRTRLVDICAESGDTRPGAAPGHSATRAQVRKAAFQVELPLTLGIYSRQLPRSFTLAMPVPSRRTFLTAVSAASYMRVLGA